MINTRFDAHPIWYKEATPIDQMIIKKIREGYETIEANIPLIISKKTMFLSATQKSFDKLNDVEKLKNKKTVKMIDEVARFFVKPLKKTFNGFHPSASKKNNAHQSGLFACATSLGAKMRAAKSFTDAEVRSSATKDRNAVKAMRRELKGG